MNLTRLKRALESQRDHLYLLLEAPNRDDSDFHIPLAGTLRSMLCDKENPTLLSFQRAVGFELLVWGPYPPWAMNMRPPDFSFNALVASVEPVFDSFRMRLEDYIDAPIGAVNLESDPRKPSRPSWYTPRKLIKSIANKEGAAHYDHKQDSTLSIISSSMIVEGSVSIKTPAEEVFITQNDSILVRIALLQLGSTIAALADYALQVEVNS